MEALIRGLQSDALDLRDASVRSAALTLEALLGSKQSDFSEAQEACLIDLTHAVICKSATASGGDPLLRSLHAAAVAFALSGLERSFKRLVDDSSAQSPLAFLELLEAATIKDKAEEQSTDALGGLSKYDDQQLPFDEASMPGTTGATAPDISTGPSLATALLAIDISRRKSSESTLRSHHWLPLAKDLSSATLHHAILYERLVTRILAVCNELLHVPILSTSQAGRDSLHTWQAIRKPLSLVSQLLPYLEEILLLQAPLHIAREVEQSLFSIACQLGPIYELMLEKGQKSAAEAGEEGPGELLLVNELLGVAETARVSPVVLVNLKALLAATLVDTIGKLELPDVESLLEPGSAFSDAHESLPSSGDEHLTAGTGLPELGPSLVSLTLQLIQEVDQELNPFEVLANSEQGIFYNSEGSHATASPSARERLVSSEQSKLLLGGFDWTKQHSREHLLSLILPPSGLWLNNLVAMLLLTPDQEVYAMAEDAANENAANDGEPVLSKTPSTKLALPTKEDNLFGDLFQEAVGSRLIEAPHREPPLESAPHFSAKPVHSGGWTEAAVQVAQFLGGCAFDDLWCSKVLEASCALLKKEHIAAIVASYVLAGGLDAGGLGARSLGSALHGLVQALTEQDNGLAKSPWFVHELAVQLFRQGCKASGLLSILTEWLARKASCVQNAAPVEAWQVPAPESRDGEQQHDEGAVDVELRGLVNMLWNVLFQTLGSLVGAGEKEPSTSSVLEPLEHALGQLPNQAQIAVLLLGFHLLMPADKRELLQAAVGHISNALSTAPLLLHTQPLSDGESTSRAVQQLAISRLVLLVGSLLVQDGSPPIWLLGQVQELRNAVLFELKAFPSKAEHLSLTSAVAWHVSSSCGGHLLDEALRESLFLLDMPGGDNRSQPGPLDEVEEALVSPLLHALLPLLALPGRHFGSGAEALIDRYFAEVCWRFWWLWPLSKTTTVGASNGPAERALCVAQVLDAGGLAPKTAPQSIPDAGLLDAAWADVKDVGTGWESEPLLFSVLAVMTAGLQDGRRERGSPAEAATALKEEGTHAVSRWLRSKGSGALLEDLCTLLARAASRYDELLRSYLEKAFGAETAQMVMVLLHARISDRSKYEGVLMTAGISSAVLEQLLLGGRALLDTLKNAPLGSKGGLRESTGLVEAGSSPRWEAAILLPGFPSTAETASSALASCQMLITAVLGCMDALLALEDCDEGGRDALADTLGHAVQSGLMDSEGALIRQIRARLPSTDPDKEALHELGQSVQLCQDLLQQSSFSSENDPAAPASSLSQTSNPSKMSECVLEATLFDVVGKLGRLLNDSSGRGPRVLLAYFSLDGDETGARAALGSEASSHVSRPRGDLTFLLTALQGNPSIDLNDRIVALLLQLVNPEKKGLRLEPSQTGSGVSGEDTGHLQALLGQTCACHLRKGLLTLPGLGSTWLRERLLGNMGGSLVWNVPAQQRLSARSLIEALVESEHGSVSDFRSQVVRALLANLKLAYTTFEAKSVDAYFELTVHLSADTPDLLQSLLEVVLDLLHNSSVSSAQSLGREQLGQMRKLLGFLGAVLSSAVAVPASQQEALPRVGRTGQVELRERSASRNRAPQVHGAIAEGREDELGKEQSDLEEEEEDLISFGEDDEEDEVFENDDEETIDMDEEEDGFESGESTSDDEDAKLCTFGASGSNFVEQHWYFCYTCDLTVSKGCCSTCARVCHKDHKVVYSKFSRFFCDCGAGASRANPCQCLRPRAPRSDTSSSIRGHGASSRGPAPAETASDSGSDAWFEAQGVLQNQAFPKLRVDAGVLAFLEEKGLEKALIKLCDEYADALGLDSADLGADDEDSGFAFDLAGGMIQRSDILSFTRAHKYGTFETRLKMEYSAAREIRAAAASGAIHKSLLSASKRGKVAVGEGDKVTVFELALLTVATGEKGAPKPLSKNGLRFQVLNVEFNPANDAHLVVSGYEDCQVFILNPRGEVTDRLAVELALEPETFLVQASWVPGSQVELLVASNRWVKIYDLSKDEISPLYYVRIPQESIKEAVLAKVGGDALCLIVLSQQGVLFTGRLTPQEGHEGAITLSHQLQLPPDRQWPGSRGCSLSYFTEHRTLIASYEDGQVMIGQLNESLQTFERACFLSQDDHSGNLHFWRAVDEASGVFVAADSSRQGGAVAVQLSKGTVETQPLRQIGASSTLKMEGVTVCVSPGNAGKCSVLVLNDDGSLQVFGYASHRTREAPGASSSSRVASIERKPVQQSAAAPSFPLTFFESATCITQSVSWGGDLGDSDAIKLSLAAEESFLEAPNARAFRVVVNNLGAETVMVGCRVHVGATGRANVPSRLHVFDRTIVLEEGVRRWYDVPFTVIESLTADRSFTLLVDPAPSNQLARIDVIEVYARSKDDFGWREKVESMRDLLQQDRAVVGSVAAVPVAAGALYDASPGQPPLSPVEEGLCAGLEVLALFCSWVASGATPLPPKPLSSPRLTGHEHFVDAVEEQSEAVEEPVILPALDRPVPLSPSSLPLLEKLIFARDPYPSVQSLAQRVLASLYPTPHEAQRAKDCLLLKRFAESVGLCAHTLANGSLHAQAHAARIFGQRLHWASEIAEKRPEHFTEVVSPHGVVTFSKELLTCFEGVVSKGHVLTDEIITLTSDLIEVLCGLTQLVQIKDGDPAEGPKISQLVEAERTLDARATALSEIQDKPSCEGADTQGSNVAASREASVRNQLDTYVDISPPQTPPSAGQSQADFDPIISILRSLLIFPLEPVRSAASASLSSYLLQLKLAASATPLQNLLKSCPQEDPHPTARGLPQDPVSESAVQFSCDGCNVCPIARRRWHCTRCPDFDLCEKCYQEREDRHFESHLPEHRMVSLPVEEGFAAFPNPRNVAEALAHPMSDSGEESDEAPPEPSAPQQPKQDALDRVRDLNERAIEVESMGEETLLRLALELSMQDAQPQVADRGPQGGDAPLEEAPSTKRVPGTQVLAPASDRPVGPEAATTSAQTEMPEDPLRKDRRATFRGALLANLVEDVSWMHQLSGLEAVPLLQLLAQVASADATNAAPGLDGFDLSKLVRNMLLEIDLGVALPVESRSKGGEVATLALKLFAFVVNDWEGTDEGLSAARDRKKVHQQADSWGRTAKDELRQQALLDYLLSILQRLVPEFAKQKREKSGALGANHQGALLHLRHDKAVSSLRPFFPDSYTRAHGRDVFAEFPKLLLGAALDLAEALTENGLKVEASGVTEEAAEGSWIDVLCSYIYCPQTHFIRDSARHVLLQACLGSRSSYNLARDGWLLRKELQQLQKLADKSDSFQLPLSHERSVKLIKCMGVLAETAEKRPDSWQWLCASEKHADAFTFLLRSSFFFVEEAAVQALKLLSLAFADGKNEAVQLRARPSVSLLLENIAELERFVRFFLLDFGSKGIRAQARALLQNAWLRAERDEQRSALLACLVAMVPQLLAYGANLNEASGLLKWILEREDGKALLTPSGLSSVVLEALRTQNRVLERHPYARAYAMLQALIDFDGYYLESEPCTACSSVEVPYAKLKLESIKQETKYTDNRILLRCASSYTLESFSMNVHDARRSKSVKVLRLYYNNSVATDLSELKTNWGLWKKVKSYHLVPNQAELKAELTAPVIGCNFMFEFAELYENLQASSLEHLQCPRCSRHVTDKHGICPHCHENCFQCRQCRNINYENLDSFLCNECGYSKYGRFEFSVNAKPSFAFDAIESEDDMQKCLAVIEKESENAHKQFQLLAATKKPLLRLLSTIGEGSGDLDTSQAAHQVAVPSSTSSTLKVNQTVAVLGVLYGNKCKEAFEQVSRSVQTLHGARKALTAFLDRRSTKLAHSQARPTAPKRPVSRCYGCASTFVSHALEWLHLSAGVVEEKQKMVGAGLVLELFESRTRHGSQQVHASTRSLICTLVRDNKEASESLLQLLRQRLLYCLEQLRNTEMAVQAKDDCHLLRDAVALNDCLWEPRLKLTFEVLFRAVELGTDSPPVAENIILPCLRIVTQACQVPQASHAPEAARIMGTMAADSSQAATRTGGLSQAFAGRAQERPSFAELASGAIRGAPGLGASSPQPSRPPPVRPNPLTVPAQSLSEKGAPLVTYKQWANEAVTFEDYVQQHRRITMPTNEPPKQASGAQARGAPNAASVATPRTRSEGLARKVLQWWRDMRRRRQLGVLDKNSWLKGLLLSTSSPIVRTEACALVRMLATSGGQSRKLRFLDLTTELLTSARDAGAEAVVEYFDLYKTLLTDEDARLYLAAKGWLKNACALIVLEVHRIRAQEGNYLLANVNEGFALQHLVACLSSFLEIQTIKQRFVKDGLLASMLEALLCLKSLVIEKTQLTTRCAQDLTGLLAKLLETGEETQRSFVRACMSALEEHTARDEDVVSGQRAATFIMNQVCDVIRPVRPEPVYLLTLNKAHSQEEFIRGSMAQNPYSSVDVGPLMRDVKNKICTQLEMLGLIEDDYGMELLVAGSIVSLDLSIKQVYEKVWLRTQQAIGVQSLADCPPMTVTYRLQGLDGEATEPMISEVDDDRGEQLDPEVEFALTKEMEACGGLQLLLKLLRQNPPGPGELGALLKLLGFCCKVRANRRTLLRLDALHVLLERARAAVSVSSTDQDGTAEALLEIIESLVTEANEIAAGEGNVTPPAAGKESVSALGRSEFREQDTVAAVKMFLDKLSHRPQPIQGGRNAPDSKGGKQSQADAVARILPYLTYGEPAAMECLIGHFTPFLDFQKFDSLCTEDSSGPLQQQASDHRQRLESFVKVCESIRLDANGDLLKTLFLERGLVAVALNYLKAAFPLVASAGAQALEMRSAPSFSQALLLPSVPIVLGMLTGLANGHMAIQGLLEREGLLPLLHALEGVSSEQKEIRAKAEGLLDIFLEGSLAASVNALRQATKDELRVRAMKRREAMLKALGMASAVTSDGAERIKVKTKPKIEGLDDVEEEGEDSLSCMVCREGYKLKPTECLGTYTFSKRVNAGPMLGARSEHIYTTVSHFNVIHFTCHQEAKRADSKLKTPKKEWEGAALRNSETLTNSIFPLRGPAVSSQNYSRFCDQYWENLSTLGRSDGSRFKLLAYDLASLLGRFAAGASFSADSHGGGKESNSQLLPFMVQMGAYLLEQVGSTQRRALRKSLQAYLGVTEASRTPGAGTPGSGSRRSSFVDGPSTPPASELASTPGGSSLPPRSPAPSVSRSLDESIHLMLVLSLLMHSLEEWHKHRREFLQRGLHFAYNQARQSRPLVPVPSSPSPGSSLTDLSSLLSDGPLVVGNFDPQAAFKAVKPLAIMVALVHKLQTFFKKSGPSASTGGSTSWPAVPGSSAQLNEEEELSFAFPRPETPGEASPRKSETPKSPSRRPSGDDWSSGGEQSWERVMQERLRDIPAMLAFAREFREAVEELHAAEDLMELLDTVDCLSDIYPPGGGGSWQAFLEHSVFGVSSWGSLIT